MSDQPAKLEGKNILLGVTGGIAAYKSADIASRLVKLGASVDVVMTSAAQELIRPRTFQALTHRQVYTGMWEDYDVEPNHIAVADRADLVIVAPATANTLAKLAQGIADNLLSTMLLATRAPVLVAPAMNTNMLEHPATQANLELIKSRGVNFVGPESGRLACGIEGAGRMSEPSDIIDAALSLI